MRISRRSINRLPVNSVLFQNNFNERPILALCRKPCDLRYGKIIPVLTKFIPLPLRKNSRNRERLSNAW